MTRKSVPVKGTSPKIPKDPAPANTKYRGTMTGRAKPYGCSKPVRKKRGN